MPTATASDCASQDVHEATGISPVSQARAGDAHPPVQADGHLVRDERPPRRHPRAPLLDLLAAAEAELALHELHVETPLPEPLETSAVLGMRIDLPATTRATPASCSASTHGGVVP
jgi:hypothetical protein